MCQRSRHPGFTLIELVLVLMIIAICAAIAAPTLSGFARGRALPNASIELVTTARWCRVKALSDGLQYRLNFDTTAGKWWVTKDDGNTAFADVTEDMGREYIVPEGVVIANIEFQTAPDARSDAGTYISFFPGGKTEVAKVTLTYEDHSAIIECDTPLGSYHVVEAVNQ